MTVGEGTGQGAGTKSGKVAQDIAFYNLIIENLPVGVLTVNRTMKVTSFNPWAEKLTGYHSEEAVGKYCGDILQGGMCKSDCPLKTAIHERHPMVRMETTIRRKDGESIPVRMHTAALMDEAGGLIGAVEAFQDVSSLKSMEREKDNLISMFAHDMKSSLTIIGGFVLRLLKKAENLSAEKQKNYLTVIQKETGKLDFLVKDFLEFARLQTGKLKLEFQSTSLDKELMELFEAYQSRAMEAGISLELHNETILPVIEADPNRLRRAFTNILDNAFKYSKSGGSIQILPEIDRDEIMIHIKDQGPGISAQDLPHIFEAFYRGRQTTEKEGTGLGLASVKSIVEAHGGRVSVESTPGKGALFTVTLPKSERWGGED
jgi:two-component system phosphate regulon sensor histidine kinase PhoR